VADAQIHRRGRKRRARDVVDEFLTATKNRDLATLAKVSIVGFPGEVQSWRIARVTAPREELFDLTEAQRKLNNARAARDAKMEQGNEVELGRIQSRVDRLRREVEQQREAARKSLETWSPIDEFEGEIDVSEVEVSVRSPNGSEQTFSLTVKRYRLIHSPDTTRPMARWVVTEIQ
jgi:hypothetical protein